MKNKHDFEKFNSMIGERVWKRRSHKPFKSKLKVNTVKGVIAAHPKTGYPCFTFKEDESYVECFRCEIYKGAENV